MLIAIICMCIDSDMYVDTMHFFNSHKMMESKDREEEESNSVFIFYDHFL